MKRNYVVRRRQNKILYSELFIASILIGLVIHYKLNIHPAISLLLGLGCLFLLAYLIPYSRVFRYFFAIAFSFVWGFGAYLLGAIIDGNSIITSCVFASLAFLISIWAHYDHYKFLKNAKVYEYEKS
jgi:hypothetical protein